MSLRRKLRKIIDGDGSSSATSARGSAEYNEPDEHPIADQFIQEAAQQREEPQRLIETHIPRKPVPFGTPSVQRGTVRLVSGQSDSATNVSNAAETDGGVDDLAPAIHQLGLEDFEQPTRQPDEHVRSGHDREDQVTTTILRTSLDKPLPSPPGAPIEQGQDHQRFKDIRDNPEARNIIDTAVHTQYAPAITHETIIQPEHEIEERRIEREIHQDHIYHRILPIEHIAVGHVKHYVKDSNGTLKKIGEEKLSRDKRHAIANTFKTVENGDLMQGSAPRQFTARAFHGAEGDKTESVDGNGVLRSEETWVHPPRIEEDGRRTGQTVPLHLP